MKRGEQLPGFCGSQRKGVRETCKRDKRAELKGRRGERKRKKERKRETWLKKYHVRKRIKTMETYSSREKYNNNNDTLCQNKTSLVPGDVHPFVRYTYIYVCMYTGCDRNVRVLLQPGTTPTGFLPRRLITLYTRARDIYGIRKLKNYKSPYNHVCRSLRSISRQGKQSAAYT